jgi:hypothetical protein
MKDAKETVKYLYQHGHIIQHEHYTTICTGIQRLEKAVSLLNSMVEGGESHSETSRKIVEQAMKGGD